MAVEFNIVDDFIGESQSIIADIYLSVDEYGNLARSGKIFSRLIWLSHDVMKVK